MKLQAIYNCLQRDISSKYGEIPQLDVSRAPLFEALWKDLLITIEMIGIETVPSVRLGLKRLQSSEPGGFCIFRLGVQLKGMSILLFCPHELVSLVEKVLVERSAPHLQAIRQICLFTYKSKSNEVTTKQRAEAAAAFRHRNRRCLESSWYTYNCQSRTHQPLGQALRIARLLCGLITHRCDWREINPSHGPGAVSDARKGYDKWRKLDGACCRITDKMYPIAEYFTPTPDRFNHRAARFVDPVCKFSLVPKDKRGPRVICTQPVGLMWIQQGQRRVLERAIETSSILSTNRVVNDSGPGVSIKFDRQENNGSLALESSKTREFATIDLKDASDLVSWGLVRFLFCKETCRFLAASRATHVKIGDAIERLHMFAPMGSAMCFPVESLVFWSLATAATLVSRGVTYEEIVRNKAATKWLQANRSEVFVFGDDILVRREACKEVCDVLTGVGLVPNLNKTFSEGFYRESCGVDAFHGVRLDIARLQNLTITSMSDAYAVIDLAKRARRLQLVQLSTFLEIEVETFLRFPLAAGCAGGALWERGWPCNREGAAMALSWNLRRRTWIRYNTRYQYFEARTVIARPRHYKAPQDGRCRLFRGLTTGVDEHTKDWLLPDNQQYHLGWVRAF